MARKTITIAKVGEVRTFGDNGKALPIWGEDEMKFECYKTQLFEHLTAGATVECEVEDKQSKDGRFINHNIQGVFKDGQPVGQRQGGGQGGGRSYGKSPDERASIERQVAVKEVGEALRMGLPVTPEIQGAYWRIVAEWLNAPQSAPAGQGAASASNPIPTGQSGANFHADRDGYRIVIPTGIPQPRTSRDDAAELDRNFEGTGAGPRTFDTTLAFLNAAVKELGLTQTQILTTLGIEKGADLYGHDLSIEWQKLVKWGQGNG